MNNKDKPYIENYPPLQKWLNDNDAQCMWQIPYGNHDEPFAYVENWIVNNTQVIIVVYSNNHGWNIFTPCQSISIDATLRDASERCKL